MADGMPTSSCGLTEYLLEDFEVHLHFLNLLLASEQDGESEAQCAVVLRATGASLLKNRASADFFLFPPLNHLGLRAQNQEMSGME